MIFESMEQAREHYDKLRQKNERNFQESGEPKYDDATYRYQMIVDAMDAYLERKEEQDHARHRRHTNVNAYIDRYLSNASKTYTRNEVIRMLREVEAM